MVLSRMHWNVEICYVGKISRTGIGRLSKQRRVVLRRRNTVVGGKCSLPSALLVCHFSPIRRSIRSSFENTLMLLMHADIFFYRQHCGFEPLINWQYAYDN